MSGARLTVPFPDEQSLSAWVTKAICRGLLPEIAGVFRADDGELALADVRHAAWKPLPVARPSTGVLLDTHDQRAAVSWLISCLLAEVDSLEVLEAPNVNPDNISLDGSDVVCRDATGRQLRIQVLAVDGFDERDPG